MVPTETMPDMDAKLSLRQFAGTIVMDEIARYPGRDKMRRVTELSDVSRSTIYNMRDGVPSVTGEKFRALEGVFGLPTRFFDLVIAGDVERIRALPGRDQDPVRGIPEELRHYVIESLHDLTQPHNRRAADSRKRA